MDIVPRVLTVEDEPDLRLILQDNLEFEGYEVLSASTGEEGLDLAMAKQPDLVLLDLLLPRMSGYEVCRRLRAEQFTMPIIMLTARNAEMDRVAGLELGADDYMGKPFGVKELLARVRVQLRRPRAAARHAGEVRVGEVTLDLRLRRAHCGRTPLDLSSREFELLEYLLDHADRRGDPRGTAARGLGLQRRTLDADRGQLRRQAAQESRARPAQPAPHPHRARVRLSPRAIGRRRPAGLTPA